MRIVKGSSETNVEAMSETSAEIFSDSLVWKIPSKIKKHVNTNGGYRTGGKGEERGGKIVRFTRT